MKKIVPYTALMEQFHSAPPGKLCCITGANNAVFRLSLSLASQVLLKGVPVAVVDGSNRFDAYMIAEIARSVAVNSRGGVQVTPEDILERIFVARAFTCYQMEATVTERLPAFVRHIGAPVAMIFGLLDTFYDEQAPLFEVKASVGRIISSLRKMKESNIAILLASKELKLESKERNRLLPRVKEAMDHVYQLQESDGGRHYLQAQVSNQKSGIRIHREHPPSHSQRRTFNKEAGEQHHGPHSTNLYDGDPAGNAKLVEISARTPQGGPGSAG